MFSIGRVDWWRSGFAVRLCLWRACGFALLLGGAACAADAPPRELVPDWVLKVGGTSDSSAAVAPDGTVYFGTFKGDLWAANPDGTKRWKFAVDHEIRSSPAVGSDGTVYFGSRNRNLYAVTPAGKKIWAFKTGGWVDASPAIASDGAILVGSWDNKFYAVAPDGARRWEYATSGPIVSSAAIGTNGVVYFGSQDGLFYALDAAGRELWRFKTGGAILSSPALDEVGQVYFTSVDGFFYALDAAGKLRWKVRTGSVRESSPVIGLDGALILGAADAIWSVSAEGQARKVSFEGETIDGAAAVSAGGEFMVVFRNGQICGYNSALEFQWRAVVLSCGLSSPAITGSGRIYLTGWVNNLVAIPYGHALATTAWPKFRGNLRNTGNLGDHWK